MSQTNGQKSWIEVPSDWKLELLLFRSDGGYDVVLIRDNLGNNLPTLMDFPHGKDTLLPLVEGGLMIKPISADPFGFEFNGKLYTAVKKTGCGKQYIELTAVDVSRQMPLTYP